jgi:hypothetical protein
MLGNKSNGAVDIDLDCDEAVAAAGTILQAVFPGTPLAAFGRGPLTTHYMFRVEGKALTKAYIVPGVKREDGDKSKLIELRGDEVQTVIPPSMHHSGHRLEWRTADGAMPELPLVTMERLQLAAGLIATVAAIVRKAWVAGI